MTKRYETVFILTPVLSSNQVEETVKEYKKFIKSEDGKFIYESNWGLKKLAYPIQKKTTGFYHLLEFETKDNNFINKIETKFKRDEKVMRFLCVSMDKHAIAFAESHRSPKS